MSILKNMLKRYSARDIADRTMLEKELYIHKDICDDRTNAYCYMDGTCHIIVKNPINRNSDFVEFGNLPTYTLRFTNRKMALRFVENNFFHGHDLQKNIRLALDDKTLTMQPTNLGYEMHIEVNNMMQGEELVRIFRAQYAYSKQLKAKAARHANSIISKKIGN